MKERMILRTPPPKRQRSEARAPESPSMAGSDLPLVIYEDPPSAVPQAHPSSDEHLLCTYQCRQMVILPTYFPSSRFCFICVNYSAVGALAHFVLV